jgi:hypothetical protein
MSQERRCCVCTSRVEDDAATNSTPIENAKNWLPIDTKHLTIKDDDIVLYLLCPDHHNKIFNSSSSISPKELRYSYLLRKYARRGWEL